MSQAIEFLHALAQQLHTQDNDCTASPLFRIEERRLITGLDPDQTMARAGWFNHGDGSMADEKKAKALERYYDHFGTEPADWTRTGCEYRWEGTDMVFLTRAAADAYVAKNAHRHTFELRVNVDTAIGNPELREVRRLLAGPVQECIAALAALEKANDARAAVTTSEGYCATLRAPGMREALEALDEARRTARAALAALDTAVEPQA